MELLQFVTVIRTCGGGQPTGERIKVPESRFQFKCAWIQGNLRPRAADELLDAHGGEYTACAGVEKMMMVVVMMMMIR